ncbi:hypothetical protein [Streptomyces cucumeris]|uniref:hypothetical protein n=1 Tax=Streptomyces cucumeris TaxID=2962890 RepID=UPI0020C91EA1|nr:hypothetical protein [Streptomyces sp. NEAU-Y11]MCP9211435.1 hypothetical protein [Streptomyces sp. NEAU-Y11]
MKNRMSKPDTDNGIEDVSLLILEWLGEQGVSALIRFDAERPRNQWTFAASGEALPEPVRNDAMSAAECLSNGLVLIRRQGMDVPF